MKLLLIIFTTVLLGGCAKLMFATANTTTLTFDGDITEDVAYGTLPRQQLDIFVPEGLNNKKAPVVIFFHGGRWSFGSKDQYQFVGIRLASMGYVAVLPNTRLYPEVKFPIFVEDAAASVAWVQKNIHQYGGNEQLIISGHSSGAHIGALVVADERYLKKAGGDPSGIDAFVGMAGPYDFTPKADDLRDMFGPPDEFDKMVVSHYIDGSEPPFALMYSSNDGTVHERNLKRLKAKIESVDGQVSTYIYEKGEHTGTVAALSWANPDGLPVADDMQTFIQHHLKTPESK
ncbi:alpha/beta hydrolase [Salinimonas sp. HHU 13199]|uniref:Alpha/beta hydrolase n=1 Tax=Salinimonas profundi TaxID=2729140 RepID=A0ABR8LI94_9ALTE|nr:alpha/beta hydrolase [Salinimonas profundi]MBD3585961.1 alpha/beta hydrolase [Salinimonas profundi]